MKKYLLIACLFVGGCSLVESGHKAKPYVDSAAVAIDRSEPVVSSLEDATGYTVNHGVASKGESISKGIAKGARIAAPIADTFVPGAGVLIGMVGTLAGAMGTFFQNRKRKAAEKQRDAVMVSVNEVPGAGRAIRTGTALMGVSKEVEARYKEMLGES